MITLKSVTHDEKWNSIEATWVDGDVQVECHSYADVQMQMFRDDAAALGTSLAEYESLIATVEAAIVPYVPPVVDEAKRQALLWQAAHDVEFNAISGSAIGLITLGIVSAKPKCMAVLAWIQTLWTEYYARKHSGSTNYDFSAYDNCPHTVPELMQELGL